MVSLCRSFSGGSLDVAKRRTAEYLRWAAKLRLLCDVIHMSAVDSFPVYCFSYFSDWYTGFWKIISKMASDVLWWVALRICMKITEMRGMQLATWSLFCWAQLSFPPVSVCVRAQPSRIRNSSLQIHLCQRFDSKFCKHPASLVSTLSAPVRKPKQKFAP